MSSYSECMKSELDIFSTLPVQSNVLKTEEVAYKPIASLDNSAVLEFVSLGHGDTYRDLSSIYLRLKIQLVKVKGGREELYTGAEKTKFMNAAGEEEETEDPPIGTVKLVLVFIDSLFQK